MNTHLSKSAPVLALVAALATPRPAAACSEIQPWQSAGVYVMGTDWDDRSVRLPHGRFIPLAAGGDTSSAHFGALQAGVELELLDAQGIPIAGHLAPGVGPGTLRFVPDQPLVHGGPWHLTTRTQAPWGSQTTYDFEVTVEPRAEPTYAGIQLAATKEESPVFGECLSFAEGDCGGECVDAVRLGSQTRFHLTASLVEATDEPSTDFMRTALGTTEAEALAVLDRSPFHGVMDRVRVADVAYATWPSPEACVASEVRRLDGTVLLKNVQCIPLPEDDDLSSALHDRLADELPLAERGGAEGCQSAPGGELAGLLPVLLAWVRRRRPLR